MTNKMKQFFKPAISELKKSGLEEAVKVLSPLIQNINHTQYSKLRGHINTCGCYEIEYSNTCEGYNDGCMTVLFSFPNTQPKEYEFTFSSMLQGDYGATEYWCPAVSVKVTKSVGSLMMFNGLEKDYIQFEEKLNKELSNEEEILKLKQEIAEKQRQLSKLTA